MQLQGGVDRINNSEALTETMLVRMDKRAKVVTKTMRKWKSILSRNSVASPPMRRGFLKQHKARSQSVRGEGLLRKYQVRRISQNTGDRENRGRKGGKK